MSYRPPSAAEYEQRLKNIGTYVGIAFYAVVAIWLGIWVQHHTSDPGLWQSVLWIPVGGVAFYLKLAVDKFLIGWVVDDDPQS